jgi:hypothetical protein
MTTPAASWSVMQTTAPAMFSRFRSLTILSEQADEDPEEARIRG